MDNQITICRYCGKPLGSDDRDYCDDVCLFASGQSKVIRLDRYEIHCRVSAPVSGWVYGESVEMTYQQWVIEVQPAFGGRTLYRVRAGSTRVVMADIGR